MDGLDGRLMEEKEDDLFSDTSSVASLHSTMASSSIHSRSTAWGDHVIFCDIVTMELLF